MRGSEPSKKKHTVIQPDLLVIFVIFKNSPIKNKIAKMISKKH